MNKHERKIKLDSNMSHRVTFEFQNGSKHTIRNTKSITLLAKTAYVSYERKIVAANHMAQVGESVNLTDVLLIKVTSSIDGVVSEVRSILPFMNGKSRVTPLVSRTQNK